MWDADVVAFDVDVLGNMWIDGMSPFLIVWSIGVLRSSKVFTMLKRWIGTLQDQRSCHDTQGKKPRSNHQPHFARAGIVGKQIQQFGVQILRECRALGSGAIKLRHLQNAKKAFKDDAEHKPPVYPMSCGISEGFWRIGENIRNDLDKFLGLEHKTPPARSGQA